MKCIIIGCENECYGTSLRCHEHDDLASETQRRMVANKSRPEWWTPSEYCEHSHTFAIRVAHITSIEARNIIKSSGVTSPSIDMYYDLCSRHFHYDTPEHRDEDYKRLLSALGVE